MPASSSPFLTVSWKLQVLHLQRWKGGRKGRKGRRKRRKEGERGNIGTHLFHFLCIVLLLWEVLFLPVSQLADIPFNKGHIPWSHSNMPAPSPNSQAGLASTILLGYILHYFYACLIRLDNQSLGNPTLLLFPEA